MTLDLIFTLDRKTNNYTVYKQLGGFNKLYLPGGFKASRVTVRVETVEAIVIRNPKPPTSNSAVKLVPADPVDTQLMTAAERRSKRRKALKTAMETHGTPLHWDVLAKMVMGRNPGLFRSPRGVLHFLSRNPGHFQNDGAGVFRLAR